MPSPVDYRGAIDDLGPLVLRLYRPGDAIPENGADGTTAAFGTHVLGYLWTVPDDYDEPIDYVVRYPDVSAGVPGARVAAGTVGDDVVERITPLIPDPAPADVRAGVVTRLGVGSLAVPEPTNVLVDVAVDDTVGTYVPSTPGPVDGAGDYFGDYFGSTDLPGLSRIDHNVPTADALQFLDSGGDGIEGADVLVFPAAAAADAPEDEAIASSRTGPDGRWEWPVYVPAGDYRVTFRTPGRTPVSGTVTV